MQELELYENLKSEEEGNALREEGNKYFKQDNFTQALCYYDKGEYFEHTHTHTHTRIYYREGTSRNKTN